MKLWEGIFSFNGVTGDVTLATTTNRIKKLTKPELTAESGVNEIAKKPTIIKSVDDSGKLGISASDGKPAEIEKKGFWKGFFGFFGGGKN